MLLTKFLSVPVRRNPSIPRQIGNFQVVFPRHSTVGLNHSRTSRSQGCSPIILRLANAFYGAALGNAQEALWKLLYLTFFNPQSRNSGQPSAYSSHLSWQNTTNRSSCFRRFSDAQTRDRLHCNLKAGFHVSVLVDMQP